jgi:hypothetical protein
LYGAFPVKWLFWVLLRVLCSDAIKWNKDRRLYDHLTDLHAKTVIFAQTWCRQTEDSLAEYITDPEPEDWPKLQRVFHGVLAEVGFIISQLESEAKRLATFQFYEELLHTFVERERALRKILELPPPISIEDIRELKEFMQKYVILIEKLGKLNKSMAESIREHSSYDAAKPSSPSPAQFPPEE